MSTNKESLELRSRPPEDAITRTKRNYLNRDFSIFENDLFTVKINQCKIKQFYLTFNLHRYIL